MPKAARTVPRIVLDTNVVLDWLVFADPAGRGVGEAVLAGTFEWIATAAMRDEHFDVVGRARLARWLPDPSAHRRIWDLHCRLCPQPARQALRCADPDDQMFVDLALGERAALLMSRDKALLDIAAPLRSAGVQVMTPAAWLPSTPV